MRLLFLQCGLAAGLAVSVDDAGDEAVVPLKHGMSRHQPLAASQPLWREEASTNASLVASGDPEPGPEAAASAIETDAVETSTVETAAVEATDPVHVKVAVTVNTPTGAATPEASRAAPDWTLTIRPATALDASEEFTVQVPPSSTAAELWRAVEAKARTPQGGTYDLVCTTCGTPPVRIGAATAPGARLEDLGLADQSKLVLTFVGRGGANTPSGKRPPPPPPRRGSGPYDKPLPVQNGGRGLTQRGPGVPWKWTPSGKGEPPKPPGSKYPY